MDTPPVNPAPPVQRTLTSQGHAIEWNTYTSPLPPTSHKVSDIWLKALDDPEGSWWDGEAWITLDSPKHSKTARNHHFLKTDGRRVPSIWFNGNTWMNKRHFSSGSKAEEVPRTQISQDNTAPNPTDPSGVPMNEQRKGSPSQPPTPLTPPLPYPAQQDPFMERLLQMWRHNTRGCKQVQIARGLQLLEKIASSATYTVIPSSPGTESKACTVYGRPIRNPLARPTVKHIHADLFEALTASPPKEVVVVDALTGFVQSALPSSDLLTQVWSLSLAELDTAQRDSHNVLYSLLDVPASKNGLMSCEWTSHPCKPNESLVQPLASSWTFRSAITLPHTDSIGCALNIFHWHGMKLWIMWPGTVENLETMSKWSCLSGVQDFSTCLNLIEQLKGMELLLLDPEASEDHEIGVVIKGDTIHACLSFTECIHSGHVFRDAHYVEDLELRVAWYVDALSTGRERGNGRVAQDLLDTLDMYRSLERRLLRSKKATSFSEVLSHHAQAKEIAKYLKAQA